MAIPIIPIESVLIAPDQSVPPPRSPASMMGRPLGDIAIAALINAASGEPCIQIGIPEETSYGNDADFY